MKYLILLFIPLYLLAESSFITEEEYASELYKNPRGIGCGNCHGKHGEGKIIATYIHKNKPRRFIGPEIKNIGFVEFYKALTHRKKGMPRYYLTQMEIKALYYYLHQKEKKDAQ